MNSSKSSLLLMEMLMTIMFFSVAGAVCLQIYVKAHIVDQKTTDGNNADEWIQNLSESYYSCDADMDSIEKIYDDCSMTDDNNDVILTFDSDWNLIKRDSSGECAGYAAYLCSTGSEKSASSGTMKTAKIFILRLSDPVTDPFGNSDKIVSLVSGNENENGTQEIDSIELKDYLNAGKAE